MSQPASNPLHGLGVRQVLSMAPVTGGLSGTGVWKVQTPDGAFALRVFHPGQEGLMAIEAAAMEAAASAGHTVPAVHGTGEWEGRPAMLISWCQGLPGFDLIKQRPWQVWAIAVDQGRTLARLHRVKAPPLIQERRSDWIGFQGGLKDPDLRQLLYSLPQQRDALLHLDYHPLNVLGDGGRVTAVIDWTNVHAGDPRADVARSVSILRLALVQSLGDRIGLAMLGPILAAGLVRGYEAEAGPLGEMAPFYAWAGAVFHADMGYKIGRPGIWYTEKDLIPAERWTAYWTKRALAGRSS